MKRRLRGVPMATITAGILLSAGSSPGQFVATGGNATNDVGLYRIHVFTKL